MCIRDSLIAQLGKVARDGQAGRASANDSDLVAIGRGGGGLGMYVVAVPVGNKALQAANADGLALDAADALALALVQMCIRDSASPVPISRVCFGKTVAPVRV